MCAALVVVSSCVQPKPRQNAHAFSLMARKKSKRANQTMNIRRDQLVFFSQFLSQPAKHAQPVLCQHKGTHTINQRSMAESPLSVACLPAAEVLERSAMHAGVHGEGWHGLDICAPPPEVPFPAVVVRLRYVHDNNPICLLPPRITRSRYRRRLRMPIETPVTNEPWTEDNVGLKITTDKRRCR